MMRLIAATAALLLPACAAHAQPARPGPRAGDVYEITRTADSSWDSGEGTGSAHDRDSMIERVIGRREAGLELEYDLPASATARDRSAQWQFPARIFKPVRGPWQLLNRAALEARAEAWLRAARWPRSMCGHWIFTWNAFRIDCDPQSVIETLEQLDLGPGDLRDGAPYRDLGALAPAPLRRTATGPDGATFVAEMAVDPDFVRRESVESDLVVAEITRTATTRDAAIRARAAERISGTIRVTLDVDAAGQVRRRTRLINLETREQSGRLETRTSTEILERRLISRAATR
jgi:hypothetical protein